MNKTGFTLAEVLVTLGVIGVVAALTIPALEQNVASSKVGPSLAKAVSNFEKANQMLLTQNDAASITNLMGSDFTKSGEGGYGDRLSEYIKIKIEEHPEKVPTYKQYLSNDAYTAAINSEEISSDWSANAFKSDDDMIYYIFPESKTVPNGYTNITSKKKIGQVYVDINGYAKPNRQAKDIFRFYLYNDGTLRPYGGKAFDRTQAEDNYLQNPELNWAAGGCNEENGAAKPDTCAGSVFDNNLRVIYE